MLICIKKINNEVYQVACADYNGKSDFTIINSGWNEENNGISHSAISLRYDKSLRGEVIECEVITLNSLLNNLNIQYIDFLSIDTEGWELDVMRGFSVEIYQPKVILLENYTHAESYVEYMKTINYNLKNKIEYNYIFERN